MPNLKDTDKANRNMFDNIQNSILNMTEYFTNQNFKTEIDDYKYYYYEFQF